MYVKFLTYDTIEFTNNTHEIKKYLILSIYNKVYTHLILSTSIL